jgi:lipoprotein-anchoring transpeptidase ErfK/SrfK
VPATEDVRGQDPPLRRIDLAWRVVVVVAIVAGIAAFIVAVHGTGGAGDPAAAQTRAAADAPATIATAVKRSVDVFGHLGDGKPWTRMANPNRQGAPLVFLVERRTSGWLHVLLPTRPNGAQGWIKESDVGLSKTDYRVDVSLRRHRVVVHKGGRTVVDRPAAVGTSKTPTPTGRFFVTVLLRPPDPKGAYGPYAFGLSAHSATLFHFGGGPGQIGMHGTDEPKALGHAVSNGCVRMSDATVTKLAGLLPLGTPVTIAS